MGFRFFDYVLTRCASHEPTFKMDFRSPPYKSQESWLEKHEHERPCSKATFFQTFKPSLFVLCANHLKTSLWLALSAGRDDGWTRSVLEVIGRFDSL